MPVITEHEYRDHRICLCLGFFGGEADDVHEAEISIYEMSEAGRAAPAKKRTAMPTWKKWADIPIITANTSVTTEAQMFRWAEREVDLLLGPENE